MSEGEKPPSSPVCYLAELEAGYVDPDQARDVARWRKAERQRLRAERDAMAVADRAAVGQAIGDPGALFYIVSDLFRMTPVMLIGLLAAPLAIRSAAEPPAENQEAAAPTQNKSRASRFSILGSRWSSEQSVLLALAAFAII